MEEEKGEEKVAKYMSDKEKKNKKDKNKPCQHGNRPYVTLTKFIAFWYVQITVNNNATNI